MNIILYIFTFKLFFNNVLNKNDIQKITKNIKIFIVKMIHVLLHYIDTFIFFFFFVFFLFF